MGYWVQTLVLAGVAVEHDLPQQPLDETMRFVDFECPSCGRVYRDVGIETDLARQGSTTQKYCEVCAVDPFGPRHVACVRLPGAPAFKVNGFNAANKYSKEPK